MNISDLDLPSQFYMIRHNYIITKSLKNRITSLTTKLMTEYKSQLKNPIALIRNVVEGEDDLYFVTFFQLVKTAERQVVIDFDIRCRSLIIEKVKRAEIVDFIDMKDGKTLILKQS